MKKIKVMLSSRCDDPVSFKKQKHLLSELRQDLKDMLEKDAFLGTSLLDVWINEDAPPAAGDENAWEHCLAQANDSDIFICLYNGNAGRSGPNGAGIGICHAELDAALRTGRSKVRVVELPKPSKNTTGPNKSFQESVERLGLFRGGKIETREQLTKRVQQAVLDALVDLFYRGKSQSKKDKYDRGEALEWSRMNFVARKRAIENCLVEALQARVGAEKRDQYNFVKIGQDKVAFRVAAVPAPISVAEARELVGRPHMKDHLAASAFTTRNHIGPVHLIGCHRIVAENQALSLLGYADAVVVRSGFGIYVADTVRKSQLVFLSDCRDGPRTSHMVQLFFEWLETSGEKDQLICRAKSRRKIVETIAKEAG